MTEPTPTPPQRQAEPKGWERIIQIAGALIRGGRAKADSKTRINAILLALVAILGGVVVRGDARTDRLIATIEKQNADANARNAAMVAAMLDSTAATKDATETAKTTNKFLATVVVEKVPKVAHKPLVPKIEPRSP